MEEQPSCVCVLCWTMCCPCKSRNGHSRLDESDGQGRPENSNGQGSAIALEKTTATGETKSDSSAEGSKTESTNDEKMPIVGKKHEEEGTKTT